MREREKSLKFLEEIPTYIKLSVDRNGPISVDERGWIVCLDYCGEEQHFDLLCAACGLSFKGFWRWRHVSFVFFKKKTTYS